MRVGLRDFDRVMRLLPELYRCRMVADLLHDAVRLMAPVIPSDGCGWFIYTFDRGPRLETVAESEPVLTPQVLAETADMAVSHPYVAVWSTQQSPVPLMYSLVPRRALDRMFSDYPVASRALGADALTTPITVTPVRCGAPSFRRERGRFSDDDRAIVSLLQPHLARAFANAQAFSTMSEGGECRSMVLDGVLTERESQVAFWLTRGKTNREIGIILNMQLRTVEKHVEHLLRKLHVENRTTAALLLATDASTSVPGS
jgi:DNA-binding CsgD family transcriptional regulator